MECFSNSEHMWACQKMTKRTKNVNIRRIEIRLWNCVKNIYWNFSNSFLTISENLYRSRTSASCWKHLRRSSTIVFRTVFQTISENSYQSSSTINFVLIKNNLVKESHGSRNSCSKHGDSEKQKLHEFSFKNY